MTTERPATEPGDAEQTLLILGATGDLAARLLLPGLGRRRPQRPAGPAGPRGSGVPGRPLPGHVDGAEHHRAAFVNRMLESVLNGEHVHSIDIIFDEALALGGRAGYYDGAGALVDMIQSHSLQVLALLAMDAPSTLQARDVRDAKAAVLRAPLSGMTTRPPGAAGPGTPPGRSTGARCRRTWTRRASTRPRHRDVRRGGPGRQHLALGRGAVPGPGRQGAAPPAQGGGDHLQAAPWVPVELTGYDRPDWLLLDVNINGPDDPSVADRVTLEAGLDPGDLPPYGQVLRGVCEGDPNHSVRDDTAVECWRIVEPVLAAWRDNQVPLGEYPAGSTVPDEWSAAR